ncbi:MAG TPA: serine/threonine-protein kinase [Nannocystaceae bacterium]|nr:serine/threonine-protein kinase [Nannocystaceae bacterium]
MSDGGDPSRQTLESVGSDGEPDRARFDSPGRRAQWFGERYAGAPIPERIGRYHVLARIGVGGMGEVFAARDPELDRELAIKVVHAELDDGGGSASSIRLLREAQTLARVEHPNVVEVYEVGLFGTRVFLAMEVVRGCSLREYSKLGRPWREVIGVLAQAARGLHAVHEAGLVHRDVKPDNVLVGDDGRVRVADFGLARGSGVPTDPPPLTDEAASSLPSPSLPLPSRLTASGAVVGTPVYMAPEQLRRPIVDARCDQFGFCVMAWEALCGTRPFPGGSISVLFDAHRRGAVIPRGSSVPVAIWRALQRGTAYDPEARWSSMLELVEELERASQRRWMGNVIVAATVATAGGLALAWSLSSEARVRCDDAVSSERSQKIATLAAAAQSAGLDRHAIDGLDARADALASARAQACVARAELGASPRSDREALCLDRAEHRLDALVAALARVDARSWDADSLRAVAVLPDPYRCAATADEPTELPATVELADRVERVRSELDDAWTELALGNARAIEGRVEGLDAVANATGYAPLRAEVGWFAGELARSLGDPVLARTRLLDAAALAEASRHDEVAAAVWTSLAAVAITSLSDLDAAHDWLRRAEIASARLGDDPIRARTLRLWRAMLAREEGEPAVARRELAAIMRDAPADGLLDPSWWTALMIAADAAEATGALDEAIALHLRHLESMEARLGPDHPDVADAYYNLGKTRLARGELEQGRRELERARTIWERGGGRDHLDLALVHAALQQLETSSGSLDRARAHAEEALRIRRASLPEDDPDVAMAWVALGGAAYLQHDVETAVDAYATALAIDERVLGTDHPETALVRANAAEAWLVAGEPMRARALAEQASARLNEVEGIDPAMVAFAERVRGAALREVGDARGADEALAHAEALLDGHPVDPLELGIVLLERARVHAAAGRPSDAKLTLARAQAQLAELDGESAEHVRDEANRLARAL